MPNVPINNPQEAKYLEEIARETYGNMPQHLYKYKNINGDNLEHVRALITEGKLMFASPKQFNDPLDCRIFFTYKASDIVKKLFWRSIGRRYFPNIPKKENDKIVRERIRDSLTPDGRKQMTEDFYTRISEYGIACFTESPTDLLLWSYYSDGHRGISVRFNMNFYLKEKLELFFIPVRVKYQKEFPCFNFYNTHMTQKIYECFRTKSDQWMHEKEWRLITEGKYGVYQMPKGAIDGVILGNKIDQSKENQIREMIKSSPYSIDLFRIEIRPDSYNLQLVSA
jgi:hypothetical protein